MDTNWMHLSHPNGNWIFLVSPNHVLRILNLRTQRVAWAEQLGNVGIDVDENETITATFAQDFRGDSEVVIAMVVKNRLVISFAILWRSLTDSNKCRCER
jgi:predicted class III extradiol MEMO1 family dioxygenase